MVRALSLAAALSAALVASAAAQSAPASPPMPARTPGYLAPEMIPDGYRILPPVPRDGSAAKAEDLTAFRETRALKGGARWRLATADVVQTPRSLLEDFACALGVRLDEHNAPTLLKLFTRVLTDAANATSKAKNQFGRLRPFVGGAEPICVERDRESLAQSRSYPSGHATLGWAYGLILAELAPDRATSILARARAYGESRVVCGVHWVSDIEEGRAQGASLVAVLHADPAFVGDVAQARREVASARNGPARALDAGRCTLERDAAARTPWTR